MEPQTFTRFLGSLAAVQAHLLFGVAIVLLTVGLLTGEGPEDGYIALAFCVVFYPVVLALLWWQHKHEVRSAARDAVEREKQPTEFRRKRKIHRMFSLAFLFAASVALVIAGSRGWLLSGIPAHLLGYALLAFTAAGSAGINIWYGGPLDMRDDSVATTNDKDVT